MKRTSIAIQIASEWPSLTLGEEARNEITENSSNDNLTVVWLPGISNNRKAAGSAVSTEIILFVAGIGFASIVKPLFKAALEEAGKDLWQGLKKLTARIMKKQVEKGYRNHTTLKLVFELNDEHLAISIVLPETTKGENDSIVLIEKAVQKALKALSTDWDKTQNLVLKHGFGKDQSFHGDGGKQIHVLRKIKGKWTLHPESSVSFYSQTMNTTGDSDRNSFDGW